MSNFHITHALREFRNIPCLHIGKYYEHFNKVVYKNKFFLTEEKFFVTVSVILDSYIGQLYWTVISDSYIGQLYWIVILDSYIGQLYWTVILDSYIGQLYWIVILDSYIGQL